MKTAKEILLNHFNGLQQEFLSAEHRQPFVEKAIAAMEEYSEQNCDVIHDLFNNPTKELKPLEDLWRKENSPDRFVIPDRTKFYEWIRLKILKE